MTTTAPAKPTTRRHWPKAIGLTRLKVGTIVRWEWPRGTGTLCRVDEVRLKTKQVVVSWQSDKVRNRATVFATSLTHVKEAK